MVCMPCKHNIENIVVTELKIGFLPPNSTIVCSQIVVLDVLGYSGTHHTEWYYEGVISVPWQCHLEIDKVDLDLDYSLKDYN